MLKDALYKTVWLSLYEDFAPFAPPGARDALKDHGFHGLRKHTFPSLSGMISPEYFKRYVQLRDFGKRITATRDLFTPRVREEKAVASFLTTQLRLRQDLPQSIVVGRVLQRARCISSRILGRFDENELEQSVRFGRKAAEGLPRKHGNLYDRVTNLTGTKAEAAWFANHVAGDPLLAMSCSLKGKLLLFEKHSRTDGYGRGTASVKTRGQAGTIDLKARIVRSSSLVCVPKTYKTLRPISPDTVIGGYRSNGLGLMIERRLKAAGLNIHSLQTKHRRLLAAMSIDRRHVTADLSSASDSFTASLVNRLVPRAWYKQLRFGRSTEILINHRYHHMQSFMLMGVGYTFPLQTLLFYCILKAIQELTGCSGKLSVYGDDLIYPRTMHKEAAYVLGKLGFLLNMEKTFVREHFRESCGEDYYHGCSVRPFMPEEQLYNTVNNRRRAIRLESLDLESECYKVINGLLTRWAPAEIPRTLNLLTALAVKGHQQHDNSYVCDGGWSHKWDSYLPHTTLYIVPPDFPVTAGIRMSTSPLSNINVFTSWCHDRQCSFHTVKCLSSRNSKLLEVEALPYLWDGLRMLSKRAHDSGDTLRLPLEVRPSVVLSKQTWQNGATTAGSVLVYRSFWKRFGNTRVKTLVAYLKVQPDEAETFEEHTTTVTQWEPSTSWAL